MLVKKFGVFFPKHSLVIKFCNFQSWKMSDFFSKNSKFTWKYYHLIRILNQSFFLFTNSQKVMLFFKKDSTFRKQSIFWMVPEISKNLSHSTASLLYFDAKIFPTQNCPPVILPEPLAGERNTTALIGRLSSHNILL